MAAQAPKLPAGREPMSERWCYFCGRRGKPTRGSSRVIVSPEGVYIFELGRPEVWLPTKTRHRGIDPTLMVAERGGDETLRCPAGKLQFSQLLAEAVGSLGDD